MGEMQEDSDRLLAVEAHMAEAHLLLDAMGVQPPKSAGLVDRIRALESRGSGPILKEAHNLLNDAGIALTSEKGYPLSLPYRVELLIKLYLAAKEIKIYQAAKGGADQRSASAEVNEAHDVLDRIVDGEDVVGDRSTLGLVGRVQELVLAYRDAKDENVKANQAVAQLAMGAIEALDEVDAPPGPSVPARIKALAEQHSTELAGTRLDHADVSSLRALVEQHGHVYGVGGTYDRTATVDYSDPDDVVKATRDMISRMMAEVANKTIERDEARSERNAAQRKLQDAQPAAEALAKAQLDVAIEMVSLGDQVPATLRDKILALLRL